jgi:hypothetical protein
MTIEFDARPENNLLILVHAGTTTDEEFQAFYRSLFESGSIDPSMNLLVDLREADSSPRSPEVLNQFAEFVEQTFSNSSTIPKVAVVAPKDLSFGLARMYQVFANSVPWNFVVFRAMDAALAWLRVPEDLMNRNR